MQSPSRSRSTSARASPTRPARGAPSAPGYVHRLPPCNDGCPAGENCQQWLYHAEEGDYEAAWRRSWRTTRCPRSWAGSATTRARPRATARSSTRRSASTPSSASSATRRSSAAGPSRSTRRRAASACSSSAPGRRACRPPTTCARLGHEVTIHDAGPAAGGMMRFGIPRYRLPRDVLDAEIQRILDLGVELELEPQGRRTSRRRCARAASTPPSSPSARTSASAPTSRPAIGREDARRRLACCAAWRARSTPLLGRRVVVYGGGNTAMDVARTAKRLGAEEAVVVYRRTRDRMPAHDFEVEEALEEGVLVKWLSTIKHADEGRLADREDGARRERLPAAHRRARGARGRLARARARPGDRPVAARRRRRGRDRATASCRSRAE